MDLSDIKSWFSPSAVMPNLVASAIWLGITAMAVLVSRLVYRQVFVRLRLGVHSKLLGTTIVTFVALGAIVAPSERWKLIPGLLLFLLLAAYSLRGLRSAGILDVYRKTGSGVSFAQSLKAVTSSLDFLGIGADKLTKLDEFEEAVKRCSSKGATCRLLLSPPENALLEQLARRNGTDPSAYQTKVRNSLRRLAALSEQRLKIEVRFYPAALDRDFQQWRLMFIDGQVCLASWTIWGKHEGKENPQLIVRERPHDRDSASLYHAFKGHFDTVWQDAKAVDLKNYK
jgi:hypothetical protein